MFYLVLSKNKNRIPFNYNKVHNPKCKISLAERKNFFEKKKSFSIKIALYIQKCHFWLKNSILNWTVTVLMIFGNGQFPVVKFWLNNCHFVKKWCNINDSPFAILGWIDIFDRFCRQFYILSWQRFWRDFSMLLAGVFSLNEFYEKYLKFSNRKF